MLRTLREMLRPPRIDTADAFRDFVTGESALIAQKTSTSYCQAKTLVFGHALFGEQTFIDALARCRWESFAAVLADVLLVAETLLRPHAATGGRSLETALGELYGVILAAHPLPRHRPEGWADLDAAFRTRLQGAVAAPPLDPVGIARHSARRLFDVLPIHSNHRNTDVEVIEASVTFQMVALSDKMRRFIDAPAAARALVA